jgi:hypothetical protein
MIEDLQPLVRHADLIEIGEDQCAVELRLRPGSGGSIVLMPEVTAGFADKRQDCHIFHSCFSSKNVLMLLY